MKNNSRDENLLQKMHAHIRMVFLLFFCCLSGCVSPNIQEVRFTKSDALALVVMGVEIDAEEQLNTVKFSNCTTYPFAVNWRGPEQFLVYYSFEKNINSSFFSKNTIIDPQKTKFYTVRFVKPGDYFLDGARACDVVYEPKKPIGFTAKAGEITYLGLTKLKTTYNLEYNEYYGLEIAGMSIFKGKNKTINTPVIQMPYFHAEGREEAAQWLFSTYTNVERQSLEIAEIKNFPESIKKDWDKVDAVYDSISCALDRISNKDLLGIKDSTCPKPKIKPVWEKKP
ncbi:MAG: hypothetical protein ACK5O1_04415 [Holosporales bacterium]